MIREFEYYHGVALRDMVVCGRPDALSIRLADSRGRLNSYIINDRVGLHIKHRSSRLSPWQFVFGKDTLDELEDLKAESRSAWLGLVCGEDGVLFLPESDFASVNAKKSESAYLRVDRDKRAMYRVTGSSGRLGKALKRGALPLIQQLGVGVGND
jgi:hypothetical protein